MEIVKEYSFSHGHESGFNSFDPWSAGDHKSGFLAEQNKNSKASRYRGSLDGLDRRDPHDPQAQSARQVQEVAALKKR